MGPAYELTPERVAFPQPATLTWRLSDDDLARSSIDNLSVATKAANGTWKVQPGVWRDEATHTVSVSASHFSAWALLQTLRLEPGRASYTWANLSTLRRPSITALVTVLPRREHWVGDSEITQLDGTRVSSTFTFAEVETPASRRGGSSKRFEVMSGTVKWYPPKKSGDCDLTVTPTVHAIAPNEGTLTVDASGPGRYMIAGGGQSVWLAAYTTYCPNGDYSFPSSAGAAWWPADPYQMGAIPVELQPRGGKAPTATINVNGMMGRGTVHLRFEPGLPLK